MWIMNLSVLQFLVTQFSVKFYVFLKQLHNINSYSQIFIFTIVGDLIKTTVLCIVLNIQTDKKKRRRQYQLF
jgi:hypothetical protein